MKLYSAIDLHSTNHYVVVQDETGRPLVEKKLDNRLGALLGELKPFGGQIEGIAVESTYNWYWLVDGLMEEGYRVHLVNTAAVQQYSGLKYCDDKSDARWLAHLLRLGILPTGYIYPKEQRRIRDALRKRGHLVRQRSKNILSLKNLFARETGRTPATNAIYKDVERFGFEDPWLDACAAPSRRLFESFSEEIKCLEKALIGEIEPTRAFELLKTTPGIGDILAATILLETGPIGRFEKVGQYASYCRLVGSRKLSNGKIKGRGNVKNGNRYLSWAFHEAAHFALRYSPAIRRFFDKKKQKTNGMIAIGAVAHKLSRACYYILREGVPFKEQLAFG